MRVPSSPPGGHPSDAVPYQSGDAPSSRQLAPEGSVLMGVGVAWVGECQDVVVKTGLSCTAPPVEGEALCAGHKRSREKQQRTSR